MGLRKDIDKFLRRSNSGHPPEFAEELAHYLMEECHWLKQSEANDKILRILKPIFRSKLDAAGRLHNTADYTDGYSDGLRAALELVKDHLE